MPNLTLKIEAKNALPIEAARRCENIRDVRKLLKDGDRALALATRIFPSLADAKFSRLTVSTKNSSAVALKNTRKKD